MKAIWNNKIIAQSDTTVILEGNHYFPKDSLHMEYFKPSEHQTKCPWKGTASYYTLHVEGKENENAAWYYTEPTELASNIKNYVAFWKDVVVKDS